MTDQKINKRLCIYLDGTWNTENSSTNVQHAYNLTVEGIVEKDGKKWNQLRFYDRGVGTGLIDGIYGGMLGTGINENIREAYVWLVQKYEIGDQIFIFGFSRGAFTARSLVGMIKSIGILKRGAPMTVEQAWDTYVEKRLEDAENDKYAIAHILEHEDCDNHKEEEVELKNAKKYKKKKYKSLREKRNIILDENGNGLEEIISLKDYTFRENVTVDFLGIYDTVAALGTSALGIPGVVSKQDSIHKVWPTRIIKKCNHAIGIDENRGSFAITPIRLYEKNNEDHKSEYLDIFDQRWFVGAHSNIGGGYSDNFLSSKPMDWVMDGAKSQGLILRDYNPDNRLVMVGVNDSYANFASFWWPHILREKRYYRTIDSDIEHRNEARLVSLNEKIDPSVEHYFKNNLAYNPPNLLAHFDNLKNTFHLKRKAAHSWAATQIWWNYLVLIIWSLFVGYGVLRFMNIVGFKLELSHFNIITGVAIVAIIFDWAESYFNFLKARYPKDEKFTVIWNVALWHRYLSLAFALLGFVLCVTRIITFDQDKIVGKLFQVQNLYDYSLLVAGVIVTSIVFFIIEWKSIYRSRLSTIFHGLVVPIISSVLVTLLLIFAKPCIDLLPPPIENNTTIDLLKSGGGLFFVILVLYAFIWVFNWVGLPLGSKRANLQSGRIPAILKLQFAYSSTKMEALLEEWRQKMESVRIPLAERHQESKERLYNVLKTSILRDIYGFVPIYSLTFILIIWTAVHIDPSKNLQFFNMDIYHIPIWLLVINCFILDQIENIFHLVQIKSYVKDAKDRVNSFLAPFASFISLLKSITFLILTFKSIWVIVKLCETFGSKVSNYISDRGYNYTYISLILVLIALIYWRKRIFKQSAELQEVKLDK